MLSFELSNAGRGIQIVCNDQGMNKFIESIEKLQSSGDRLRLLTPSNGGHELDEKSPWGVEAVGEVIITRVDG